jgi:hypothetical protein
MAFHQMTQMNIRVLTNPMLVAEQVNVSELLDGVLEFYKQRFDSLGISVQADYTSNVNVRVHAVVGQFRFFRIIKAPMMPSRTAPLTDSLVDNGSWYRKVNRCNPGR